MLQYAGASLSRDSHDALMVSDTRDAVATYTGKNGSKVPGIIDSQEDNKPADAPADWSAWPTLESKECPADADGDGMPDAWEQANGLNPNDASDRNTTNSEGYTMLEVYMNSIVADIMTNEVADGVADGIRQGEQTTDVYSENKIVVNVKNFLNVIIVFSMYKQKGANLLICLVLLNHINKERNRAKSIILC